MATTSGGIQMAVSHQSDTISVYGHDTINVGTGSDSIYQLGQATVFGSFGTGQNLAAANTTLLGGTGPTEFVGPGMGSVVGGLSHVNAGQSVGQDSTGGAGANVLDFLSGKQGGDHVITNFVSGQDKLYLEGYSLSYLQQHGEVSSHGGNTYISLDSGKTTIELKGVGSLHSSDITTHKP